MINKPIISIFTPTYNRAHLLKRLYESLLSQNKNDFEWVIVDDGSTDDTETLVQQLKQENKIKILYKKKNNEGKHIAINHGLEMANGSLFFIVDSDDYLTTDAVEKITSYYSQIMQDENIAGISFRRGKTRTEYIGTDVNFVDSIKNVFEFRYQMGIKGDMAEVYKTEVLKKYPFPKFGEEKFCPESLVWNRIGKNYQILWTSHIVYICTYLEGGLTDKIIEVRKNSPIATTTYYSELEKAPIPFISKLKATINYWRFAFYLKKGFIEKVKQANIIYSMIGFPLGTLMFLKDNIKGK